MNEHSSTQPAIVMWAILVEGGMALGAWGLGLMMEHPPTEQLQPDWRDALWGLAAVLPLLPALWLISNSRWPPFRRLTRIVEKLLLPLFGGCSYLDLALISILAGIGEEALFRGVIQTAAAGYLGVAGGIALASILFGLAHLITPTYGVLATMVGAYLGALLVYTDNLLVPVIVHALYDFCALMYLLRKAKTGGVLVVEEEAEEEEPLVDATLEDMN